MLKKLYGESLLELWLSKTFYFDFYVFYMYCVYFIVCCQWRNKRWWWYCPSISTEAKPLKCHWALTVTDYRGHRRTLLPVREINLKALQVCVLVILTETRRWHVTISCQPDGRPPQPVRPWKSSSRTFSRWQQSSCFRITVFYGVRAGEQKVGEWGPKIWKIWWRSLTD